MRKCTIILATIGTLAPSLTLADEDISGTYKLIVEQRKVVEAGETVPIPNPLGYFTFLRINGDKPAFCDRKD